MPCRAFFLLHQKHWYNVDMEQDFNVKHWSNPCPKYNCRKNNCKCGLRYANIPAVLGDDSADSDVAPKNGNYCNTIVEYEANGHKYIYTSEGVPVLVTEDCDCPGGVSNIVVDLPNGITQYGPGQAPIFYDAVQDAFESGRSIFLVDKSKEAEESVYTVSAFDSSDSIVSIKVERAGINLNGENGYWVIQSNSLDRWEYVNFVKNYSLDYSTSKKITGVDWIDGKVIYKKTIQFGALPDSTTKTVAHGITYFEKIVKIEAISMMSSSPYTTISLPAHTSFGGDGFVSIYVDKNDISINTSTNLGSYGFDTTYVTIYYTI